jgi:hypothetical protein
MMRGTVMITTQVSRELDTTFKRVLRNTIEKGLPATAYECSLSRVSLDGKPYRSGGSVGPSQLDLIPWDVLGGIYFARWGGVTGPEPMVQVTPSHRERRLGLMVHTNLGSHGVFENHRWSVLISVAGFAMGEHAVRLPDWNEVDKRVTNIVVGIVNLPGKDATEHHRVHDLIYDGSGE